MALQDGRNITGGTQAHEGGIADRLRASMTREARQQMARNGSREMNRDGSPASKEQVQHRRWGH